MKNNSTREVQVGGLKNPKPSSGGNSLIISKLNYRIKF